MTTFDDRERAFENRFAHDEDLSFRAQARRNRQVGLWAAHQLGHTGAEAEAYTADVVAAAIERGGADAVVSKIAADFGRHGLHITEHQIHRRMDEILAESMEHLRRD